MEHELHELGKPIGEKTLELILYRSKGNNSACNTLKRETKLINALYFINNQLWKTLFGR